MEITLEQLAALTRGTILSGDPQLKLTGFAGLRESTTGDLSFYANERYLNDARRTKASALLVPEGFAETVADVALVACANPSVSFGEVVKRFTPPPREFRAGVHASAAIEPSAKFDPAKVSIGACAVIEADVEIGDGTQIGPGCVVGHGAKIGRDCVLHPRVTVGCHCLLGDRVRLHSGVVIGADGFGYEFVAGKHQKVDQIGMVQLDNDVEIGANTTVDRARFGRTWIQEGTKIDNLVQIAHNCVIGKHVIIVAQCGVAGSTRLGDYSVVAAQAGIAGHLDIPPQTTIAARAGVTSDVREKGVYMGMPAQLMKDHQLQQVLVRKLPELVERVKKLEKKGEKKPPQ